MTPSHPASRLQGAAASRHWERLLSGEGGTVLDLQVGAGNEILAVARLGLFRSVDRGEHWVRVEAPPLIQTLHRSNGWWLGTDLGLYRADHLDGPWQLMIPRQSVLDVLADGHGALVLAATTSDGLLRSEDGGHTWEDANPGLPGDDLVAMHRSPTFKQDQTIYVATESGVFRSRNGGRAWRELPLAADDIQAFTILAHQLVIGTGADGCWMSADAGRTWRRSFPGAAIFGFGASGDGRLIVLSDAGLVTLDANGSALGRSTPPADALCAIETGNQLFVGTIGRGVVCQAPDQGEWNPSSVGLEATPRDHVRAIGHAQLVTTSPSGAILHSPDGGRSWRDLSAAPLEAVLDFDARVDAEHGLEIIACDGQRAAIHRDTWQELDAEAPLAVAWLDRAPALITADGAFVCDQFQTNMLPGRPRLIGARLIPVPGHSALLWTVLHLEDAGVLVLRSSDGGTQWELLLQTNTTNAVAIAVCVEASGREEALLAVGNGIYRLLESPAPVWTGDDAMAIAAIVIDPDGGILLATNQGLIALSPDLAWSEPVTGSPVPLLDVDIEPTGGVIVVERGGSVWRYDFPP